MSALRRGVVGAVLCIGMLVVVSGCYATPWEERERRDALDLAVAGFDPDTIGGVVCDVSGGEIGLKTGLTRLLLFDGADSFSAIGERLAEVGFRVSESSTEIAATRSDGVFVAAVLVDKPGGHPVLEKELIAEDRGCIVPLNGAVSVQFEEKGT